MILGVNLGYHSKKLYPLINDQYTVRPNELFALPLVQSLKTYDSFLFIEKTKANMLTLMLQETILII
jgi:hypothetical protein